MSRQGSLFSSRLGRVLMLCAVCCLDASTRAHAVPAGDWVTTASPIFDAARNETPMVLLPDGRAVLFASPMQIYHPDTGEWTAGGTLQSLKLPDTATLLTSGRILLAGGLDVTSSITKIAELYDPSTGVSTVTGSMRFARGGHRATLLASGKVLVSGGTDAANQLVGPAEIYDPATGTWLVTGVLNTFRSGHGAVRLSNGNVLVAGGSSGAGGLQASAEIYDVATGTWAFTDSMAESLFDVQAVMLPDGRILVVGSGGGDPKAVLYVPAAGAWVSGGTVPPARVIGGLVVLHDGTPLLTYGGCTFGFLSGGCFLTNGALFDAQTASWRASSPLPGSSRLSSRAAVVVSDGRALFVGDPSLLFRPDNTTSRLTVSPGALDFERTSPGTTIEHTLTLQNTGGAALAGSATTTPPFSLVSGNFFTLPPGGSTTAVVRFRPPAFGTFSSQVQFVSNANTLAISVKGGAGVQLSGRVTDATGAGVAGVAVNLTGAASDAAGTDGTGRYGLFVQPNNGYNVTPAGPGLTFTPSARSVIVGTQDLAGLDFTVAFSPTHLGVFRNGIWFLDLNGNAQWDGCGTDRCLSFGAPGDKAVVGDWSGTGKTKIGVFRNGIWSLDFNGNDQWDGCTLDRCPTFGQADDEPVVGDWAGRGHANIGVFRNGAWFLDVNGNGLWDGCATDACLSFGQPGDVPVVGDWTGDGDVKIGVFRNGAWYPDRNGNGQFDGCGVDVCVAFGQAGDLPVVGDWTGTGQDRIGVFRDGGWYLDLNGNGQWDGCIVDACIGFGQAGDRAVVGFW